MAFAPTGDKKIQTFCEYVYDTYVCDTARILPSKWARYLPKDMFYEAHTEVYFLTDALFEIQERNYWLTKKSKKSCEKAFIQEVMDDFEDGRIHIIDYVK